jgi:hypothetical protein
MLTGLPHRAVGNGYRGIRSGKFFKKRIPLLLIRNDIQVTGNTAAFFGRLILGNSIRRDRDTRNISGFCKRKKAKETIKQGKSVNDMQKCIQVLIATQYSLKSILTNISQEGTLMRLLIEFQPK